VAGVRTWYARLLTDLQALTTASRGPKGEVLRVGDEGLVFWTAAAGGSGWTPIQAVYTCTAVAAGNSTWVGKTFSFPGALDIDGILTVGGQVNAKLRETKLVRRTTAGTAERWFSVVSDGDEVSALARKAIIICPADGSIKRLTLRPQSAGGSTTVKIYVDGVEVDSKTETTAADTVVHFDFTSAASWSKGACVSVSIQPTNNMGNAPGTLVIEWDWRTF
jgi:hypothetical protein